MIVGGYYYAGELVMILPCYFSYEDSDFFLSLETEVWELENGNNKVINPTLDDYYGGIGLYPVDFNFCSNWSFINHMIRNKFSIKRISQNDFLSNKVSKLPNWVLIRHSQVPADMHHELF